VERSLLIYLFVRFFKKSYNSRSHKPFNESTVSGIPIKQVPLRLSPRDYEELRSKP